MTIRRIAGWALVSLCAPLLPGAAPAAWREPRPAAADPATVAGQSIYLRGVLGSGEPLQGSREAGAASSGQDAACVSCHQRSGRGSREGNVIVPPITRQYLFAPRSPETHDPALPEVESRDDDRDPYTDETLARAIREGVDARGRPLGYLMPRYALGDDDMASLIGYLKQLDPRPVPGVTGDGVVHFATIVTPDADPKKRRGMLDVLEKFFAQKNRVPLRPTPALRTSRRAESATPIECSPAARRKSPAPPPRRCNTPTTRIRTDRRWDPSPRCGRGASSTAGRPPHRNCPPISTSRIARSHGSP